MSLHVNCWLLRTGWNPCFQSGEQPNKGIRPGIQATHPQPHLQCMSFFPLLLSQLEEHLVWIPRHLFLTTIIWGFISWIDVSKQHAVIPFNHFMIHTWCFFFVL